VAYQFIKVERDGEVGIITLNRPDRLNAWHAPMRAELVDALRQLNEDPDVGAIILTGAGDRAFSAGQDLAETQQFDADQAEQWADEWRVLYGTIRGLEKPIVAALNGVGHPGVRMGQPEINAGIPSVLGPCIMWESIGQSRTVELTLTGRLMDGEEAHRIGLIHHLVHQDEVLPKALEIAHALAAKPRIAMKLTKQRFREMTEKSFQEALSALRVIEREAFASGEPQEMMARFFAEREARRKQRSQ
jgi:enoyl-CoA hydratase/carnithine racemase